MSWVNDDGLELKFGTEKAEVGPLGQYRTDGPRRLVGIKFDYTRLPTVAEGSVVISDTLTLPVGAVVEDVQIVNFTDFDSAGDAMTLNVGYIDTDRTSNADVDAYVVAATQTELNAGGTNTGGWIGTGQSQHAQLATKKLLTWEVDSAAATAGSGEIRIYYSVP